MSLPELFFLLILLLIGAVSWTAAAWTADIHNMRCRALGQPPTLHWQYALGKWLAILHLSGAVTLFGFLVARIFGA